MSLVVKDANGSDKYLKNTGNGTSAIPFKQWTVGEFADTANVDAFSRLRVSNPTAVFDSQFTYDLQPTLFEQLTNGSGASVAHDSTERCALMTFSSTATGGQAYMQSYEHFRYQPLKSQLVAVTFNFIESTANVLKFAGYSDGSNGFEFQNDGTNNQFVLYSDTTNGDQTITQANWNLDNLDGDGDAANPSGITLDITKTQIMIVDFQALYVGRVRVGFDIDGQIVYCHEFLHANTIADPYIQTANLPIRCGMTCTGTVSTTMNFICSGVVSEGGQELTASYDFVQGNNVTAGNGTDTHILSLRPKTTFNSITNRVKFGFIEVELLVTGNSPVEWKLCVGQALTTPSFADVNATYSAMQYDTAGTLSGSPAIVINGGYVPASSQVKGTQASKIISRYPITLDASGAVRDLGTLTLLVQGIGGTSATYAKIKWREIR